MLRQLEGLAGRVEGIVEQNFVVVKVEPPDRPDHDVRRQATDPQIEPGLQVADETILAAHDLGQTLGGIVEHGKAVPSGGKEAARLGYGIGCLRIPAGTRPDLVTAIGESQLFFLIGRIEPKQRLGNARVAGGDVGCFERRQVDIGEHRVFQHRLQPCRKLGPAIAREFRHVEFIGPGQSQQHVGGKRPLITLQQRDIRGRYVEIGRHIGLRQPAFPAQSAQAGTHINGTNAGHFRRNL